ncbi:hypothetical protein V6N12_000533 [Hibiscus sabdariffa]|uniref:Uncharacterized protein n=1 Tax=Hibiscus sabdariffa TaxID=183260 RepID=A0ABR1ZGU0_9ROSI
MSASFMCSGLDIVRLNWGLIIERWTTRIHHICYEINSVTDGLVAMSRDAPVAGEKFSCVPPDYLADLVEKQALMS